MDIHRAVVGQKVCIYLQGQMDTTGAVQNLEPGQVARTIYLCLHTSNHELLRSRGGAGLTPLEHIVVVLKNRLFGAAVNKALLCPSAA